VTRLGDVDNCQVVAVGLTPYDPLINVPDTRGAGIDRFRDLLIQESPGSGPTD